MDSYVLKIYMSRSLYLALLVMLLPATLRADSWGAPTPYANLSENAGIVVRVEPGSSNRDGSGSNPAHCRFFRYSEEKKTYEFWREHDLVNGTLPGKVVTPDDGSFLVTLDDYMSGGTSKNTVVVYDATGRMLKKWALNDILSEAEIKELPHSTMSIKWRGDAGVMMSRQHEVYISAPESPFKSDDYKYFKGFLLDTNALTIREDPNHKEWVEWRRSEDAKLGRAQSLRSVFPFYRLIAIVEGVILAAAVIVLALQKKRRTSRAS